MWSTIIPTQLSMVLSKIQFRIIITGWSQMGASKMGQVSVMRRQVSMKCTASTWLIPLRTGSKSTRSMVSALIWWAFTMWRQWMLFGRRWMLWILAFSFMEKVGTWEQVSHQRTRLRKTMQRNCHELDSLMIRSAMPLKGLRFMVPSNVALSAENQQSISLRVLF